MKQCPVLFINSHCQACPSKFFTVIDKYLETIILNLHVCKQGSNYKSIRTKFGRLNTVRAEHGAEEATTGGSRRISNGRWGFCLGLVLS